jgi:hypothetical protein
MVLKEIIIYKGVEIMLLENGFYVFYMDGIKNTNTNIHMSKRMITRNLKSKN